MATTPAIIPVAGTEMVVVLATVAEAEIETGSARVAQPPYSIIVMFQAAAVALVAVTVVGSEAPARFQNTAA